MIRFAELQRLDALAGVIERPHQADCRSCAERIDPCQLPPVVGPRLGPPRRACLACQRLESPEHPFCKPGALAFHPALELFRVESIAHLRELCVVVQIVIQLVLVGGGVVMLIWCRRLLNRRGLGKRSSVC